MDNKPRLSWLVHTAFLGWYTESHSEKPQVYIPLHDQYRLALKKFFCQIANLRVLITRLSNVRIKDQGLHQIASRNDYISVCIYIHDKGPVFFRRLIKSQYSHTFHMITYTSRSNVFRAFAARQKNRLMKMTSALLLTHLILKNWVHTMIGLIITRNHHPQFLVYADRAREIIDLRLYHRVNFKIQLT